MEFVIHLVRADLPVIPHSDRLKWVLDNNDCQIMWCRSRAAPHPFKPGGFQATFLSYLGKKTRTVRVKIGGKGHESIWRLKPKCHNRQTFNVMTTDYGCWVDRTTRVRPDYRMGACAAVGTALLTCRPDPQTAGDVGAHSAPNTPGAARWA